MRFRSVPRILTLFFLTWGNLPAQEFRALWVDAFHRGFFSSAQTSQLVADARRGNFNAIVVQIRKRGDAFYNSALEPKATQVTPQSYDPLADLIAKAHSGPKPLEVHAWIVTYNIWNREKTLPSQPDHPFRLHPDWLTRHHSTGESWDGTNHAFDPGHPAVQQHTFQVCMDLLENYDIDGIHLDYIRYSESGSSSNSNPWGYNPVAVSRFNNLHNRNGTPRPSDPLWLDFRREQITALVRKLYLNMWHRKPSARLSAATITWSRPPSSDSASSFTTTSAYSRVLQDWRGWMEEGILDLNLAMNYRDQKTSGRDFNIWCDRIQDMQFERAAAVGLGSFLNTTADTISQIRIANTPSPSGNPSVGTISYSYAVPNDDGLSRATFLNALTSTSIHDPEPVPVFQSTVSPPSMPWKTDPRLGNAMGTLFIDESETPADGATVKLSGPITRTLVTDATGFFGAVGLPVGNYSVTANFGGFSELADTIEIVGTKVIEFDATFQKQPFEITSIIRNERGGWELEWTSESDEVFAVQKSNDLISWTTLSAQIPSKGETTTYRDFTSGGNSQRFYRVQRIEQSR